MFLYQDQNLVRNSTLKINDIVTDHAITLIMITGDIYATGANGLGGNPIMPGTSLFIMINLVWTLSAGIDSAVGKLTLLPTEPYSR